MAQLDEARTVADTPAAHVADHNMLHRKANYVFDVMDYGAVGDGSTDDTTAIQATFDAAITSGTPATTTRYTTAPIYLPPGDYKVTAPITVTSVQGLHIVGAGREVTFLNPVGTFDCVLALDGIAAAHIGGFSIRGQAAELEAAVRLDWTTAASRSTHNVVFDGIWVINTPTRVGFAIGEGSTDRQVSEIVFRDVMLDGNVTRPAGMYEVGFLVGSGTHGNTISINFDGCGALFWDIGVQWAATNGNWIGGVIGHNGIDFHTAGTGSEISIQNVRSESSSRFLEGLPNTGGVCHIGLSNIEFHCNELESPYEFIKVGSSGKFTMVNVSTANETGKTPHASFTNPHPLVVSAIGCSSASAPAEFLQGDGDGDFIGLIMGYARTNDTYPTISGMVTI